jgi:hypothetical protein
MDGVPVRPARVRIVCCALLAVVALVGGCVRQVAGTATVDGPQPLGARPIPVADLLIEPTRFPAKYPAAVLPAKDVDRALADVDGVPAGSEVTPPECAPLPVLAPQKAAVQGVDQATGSRLTVTVVRPVPSVRARVGQLEECPTFTSTAAGEGGEVSTVTVALPPAPPVDSDDSFAVDQTVRAQSSDEPGTRTLTLVALINDVRVTASWQSASVSSPDAQALDALFTAAVLKVRTTIPR